jgi:hypothetical protein
MSATLDSTPLRRSNLLLGLAGDDLGERSLAGAGRPVKNQRLNAVGLDGAAQQLAGREDVGLSGEFVKIARAHPRGERLVPGSGQGRRRGFWFRLVFNRSRKQIVARHGKRINRLADDRNCRDEDENRG